MEKEERGMGEDGQVAVEGVYRKKGREGKEL